MTGTPSISELNWFWIAVAATVPMLAGLLLGIVENVASGYLDPLLGGGTRDLVVATVLILTVMIRPHGLFGRHDIERI